MVRAEAWFARWGVWVLLLSWAPGGDLATLVAGVLRTPIWLFALFVTFAKTGRYAVVGWLTAQAMGFSA
jgi:membrane protein YqaA with SNARE-associated domain